MATKTKPAAKAVLGYERHDFSLMFSLPFGNDEREALAEDIKKNGQYQEIILYQGKVLDGWERYQACLRSGVTPKVKQYEGTNPAAVAFGANTHRRRLNALQKAYMGAKFWVHAQHHSLKLGQVECAKMVGCNVNTLNGMRQILGSDKKAAQQFVIRMTNESTVLQSEYEEVLGVINPARMAPLASNDEDDADTDDHEAAHAEDDSAIEGVGVEVDSLVDDDSPAAPSKSVATGNNVVSIGKGNRAATTALHRPTETTPSRLAGQFKAMEERERADFVKFAWATLRPAIEQAYPVLQTAKTFRPFDDAFIASIIAEQAVAKAKAQAPAEAPAQAPAKPTSKGPSKGPSKAPRPAKTTGKAPATPRAKKPAKTTPKKGQSGAANAAAA